MKYSFVSLCFAAGLFCCLSTGLARGEDKKAVPEALVLKAQKIDESHLILFWEDPNQVLVQGYNVYSREGAKGPFFKLNSKILRSSQYYLTSSLKSPFHFQVREVLKDKPLAEGVRSLELMFSPKMKVVLKSDLDLMPRGRIDLVKTAKMAQWTDPGTKNLAGYNAYYCESPKGAYIRANEAPFGKDEAVLKYLEPGKKYYLVFTALGANGKESEPSKVLSAEAKKGPPDPTPTPEP